MNKMLLAALMTVFLVAQAHAAPGDLDTTFGGGNGWVITSFPGGNAIARKVIQQADGKLVAAGSGVNSSGNVGFALSRYNVNGSLDTTFNATGMVTTEIYDPFELGAGSVIQQADGKLVAIGSTYVAGANSFDFALVRYNTDGSLDTAFGSGGKVTTDIGIDTANSIIQQVDGRLVVAGSNNGVFALARYNSDGSLDENFGVGGKVTTVFGSDSWAASVIQRADGKLVVAGTADYPSSKFALVRYNMDGTLDTGFGVGGKVTTEISNENDVVSSMIKQGDDKLLVVGTSGVDAGFTMGIFALARYNPDGSLDTTFGSGGKVTTGINGQYNFAYSVIQQADGKLVLAGEVAGIGSGFTLVRYEADGTLDVMFGSGGKVTTGINGQYNFAYSVIQQADGKLAVAGGSHTGSGFIVARFESGQPDTDNDGIVDWLDIDNDGDAVLNALDAFPLDPTEWLDTDSDGIGDNSDSTPYGTTDSDRDTLPDHWELANGRNPLKADYMVSAGGFHSCALDNTGVKCWGNNAYGQTTVPVLTDPTMVSAGYRHTCAIDAAGVKCWGKGVTNTGIHGNFGQSIPPALNNPTMVSAGYWHTCAIDSDGVKCWGKNTKGQTNVPVLSHPRQVAAGKNYSCALDDNGVKCWGVKGAGQLTVPALVNPQSISLSVNHACAIDENSMQCWGKNNAGQTSVPGLTLPQLAAVGATYSCALDNGAVQCWGNPSFNTVGQTTVPALDNPATIDAGISHTCALTGSGVKCWGRSTLVKVPVLDFTHP